MEAKEIDVEDGKMEEEKEEEKEGRRRGNTDDEGDN